MRCTADSAPHLRTRTAGSRRAVVLLCAVLLSAAGCCARHEFLRVAEDRCGGGLEAAWVWFDPPPGRPPVLLVNMVHVGSPEFFDEVQAELDRAPVVFMEGIRLCDRGPDSVPSDESIASIERGTFDLAFELRLVTQREALAFREEYVCVDWTADELCRRASVREFAESVSRLRETVQRIVNQEVERMRPRYPGLTHEELASFVRRGSLRRQVAERLVQPPVEDPAIICGRNEEVLRRLVGMSPGGLVAICYGADHGPHLARSLEGLGYRRGIVTWHRVFGFDRAPHPDLMPVPN